MWCIGVECGGFFFVDLMVVICCVGEGFGVVDGVVMVYVVWLVVWFCVVG